MRLVFTSTAWNQYLSHTDGKLIKRPLVDTGDRVLVGFDDTAYEAALG